MSSRGKRFIYRITHDIVMASNKLIASACAILILLGLSIFSYTGTYGIVSNQVVLPSYGSINQSPAGNNVVKNGDFSNGLIGWSGESGWSNPPNPNGFGSIATGVGHDSAPCLKLENDPYGVGPSIGDVGDSGACWQNFAYVHSGQTVHIVYWCKTDADGTHSYGLRFGTDGGTGDTPSSPGNSYAGGAFKFINCSVPIIGTCPTVVWGTSSWTKVEVYGTIRPNVRNFNLWIQAWNGGLPSTGGTIGTGKDFAGAYIDDVFVSIT